MDDSIEPYEDEEEEPQPVRQPANHDALWNVLTIVLLIGVILLVGVFSLVYANPTSAINPFPPQSLPPTVALPAPTETPRFFPATWTPTIASEPTATEAPPIETATATETQFSLSAPVNDATQTAQAGPTQESEFPFTLINTPNAVASTIIYPDLGCNWFGVGGQVRDLQGAPLVGVFVRLGGTLDGTPVDMIGLTGTVIQYGPAGYEFQLGETPVASTGTLWLQLYDQANLPLSDQIAVDTFSDCSKNLALVNFKQVK